MVAVQRFGSLGAVPDLSTYIEHIDAALIYEEALKQRLRNRISNKALLNKMRPDKPG